MTLTPDRIFSRMDAGRAYAARRVETGQATASPTQMNPGTPQYAAPQPVQPPQYAQPLPQRAQLPPQPVQPPQYAQPLPQRAQLPPQYAQPQQYAIPPQYSTPPAHEFANAAEPLTPPDMLEVPENLSPAPTVRRETDQPQRPRSGTYSKLMASHDRMGTRHLG